MPVQKGKKRKHSRRRGPASPETVDQESAPATAGGARPASRRWWMGKPMSMGANLAFGVTMLVFGVVFTLIPQAGGSIGNRLLFLFLYCLLAAFYLGRALRQYRQQHQEDG